MLEMTLKTLLFVFLLVVCSLSSSAKKTRDGDDARLPTDLLPINYKLQLMPFIFEGNFTTNGEVWIELNCTATTNVITVNINDIVVDATLTRVTDLTDNIELTVTSAEYNEDLQFYYVFVADNLVPGHVYELHLSYLGQLNDLLQGFYRSSYVDSATNKTRWLATTQFSPTDARRAFPCLDEPAFKATFQINVARQEAEGLASLSNMPLEATVPIPDQPGWVWDIYPKTLPMSTYLVAFIVSDMESVTATLNATADRLQFKVWSRRDALDQTKYAAQVGPLMLQYLENYFDIPFPLPKQDMISIPDFGFNAMENWGLITYRESAMLYGENISSESNKQQTAYVMGHELGHQWFGNLVTPMWWNDLWLKEGFATYLAYLATDFVEPTWQMQDQFLSVLHSVLRLDGLLSSHPISVPVDDPNQIRQIFDRISYDKGVSIIRMMGHYLGDETFKASLTNYLNTLKFSNARQDDLWLFLTTQGHLDHTLPAEYTVQEIMDTWTLQTGYPVVTVEKNTATQSIRITQERFLNSGKDGSDSNARNVTWWVPLTLTTQDVGDFNTTRPSYWLENQAELTIPAEGLQDSLWILVNIKQTAYYRVNYDQSNWNLLSLDFPNLPAVTRSQLLDDALNLAAGSYLDYSTALNLLSRLDGDVDFLAWSSAFVNTDYLDAMLALRPAYDNFKIFMLDITEKVYTDLGFEEGPNDGHLDILNRVIVLGSNCHLGRKECVDKATAKFQEWMAMPDQENLITANEKSVVYCTAIGDGGRNEWDFTMSRYLASNTGSERELLLNALGCSRDPLLLRSYLDMLLADNSLIRKQDGSRVFSSVAGNVVGHSIAFNYLRDNWDALQAYYGLAFSTMSSMVSAIGTYMNTPEQLAELVQFRDDNILQLGTTERSFNQTIEKVEGNVHWIDNNYIVVEEWLSNYVNP